MKCPNCNQKNIVLIETQGIGDRWMFIECKDCNKKFHRTNEEEVIDCVETEMYTTMKTTTIDKEGKEHYYINFTEVNKFLPTVEEFKQEQSMADFDLECMIEEEVIAENDLMEISSGFLNKN